ncbi:MAG: ATPase [Gracilibacter sp. BRH_c7a]|nr:MAG: ATPase [Gracilibacter sp. BRH_c7a]
MSKEINADLLFHTLPTSETIKALGTTSDGISIEEAHSRLAIFGSNELQEDQPRTLLGMFIEQFKNLMVIILMAAAIISGFLGELADTFIIMIVVLLNAVLGVFQENKAEKALAALKMMSSPYSKVQRDGNVELIKSSEIVPGDLVLLEAGDYVPADMRLIESYNLKVEEAALTGESVPVEKITEQIQETDIVIGDRINMAYLGSSITYGRGTGIVTATGMATEVGKIAGYISKETVEQTPLQKKLTEMSKFLTIGIIVICIVIFSVGILQGNAYFEMFLTAVSLAVAAIPEGLPAVVTIVLALGVQRMARRNAIIRRLPAVETLGSTEIICSDKTGTLTQNKMTVKQVYINSSLISGQEFTPEITGAKELLGIMLLCNDSKTTESEEGLNSIGDPTETALVHFAWDKGLTKKNLDKNHPRLGEIPFDSERKLMTTINQFEDKFMVMTKGAVDVLLDRCTGIYIDGQIQEFSTEERLKIEAANSEMAGNALRVLGVAYKDLASLPSEVSPSETEQDLVFVGLIGMIDPPREEAKEAVRICIQAGIRPIMITGDHKVTATAIARELNIIQDETQVITGSELDKISEKDFEQAVTKYSVYARVAPEHKVRIVKAWKKLGKVVAMTGDGVNDAPALKAADIGVGMGITGTDVAKGVSAMVLSDDNFATIVLAVEEGRMIYTNIRKSVQFLLSANMSEVTVLFIATMLNWKILFPIHILWINLVTDTFPALALGLERAGKDIMSQKPRSSTQGFFSGGMLTNILYQGFLLGIIVLGVFYLAGQRYPDTSGVPITMAFATLGLIQLAHAFNVRSRKDSLFTIGFFTNPYLIGAVIFSVFLQVSVITFPFLNKMFRVVPLNMEQWLIVIGASLFIIPLVELIKLFFRLGSKED